MLCEDVRASSRRTVFASQSQIVEVTSLLLACILGPRGKPYCPWN